MATAQATPSRAMQTLLKNLEDGFMTDECREYSLNFVPQPSDVIICTPAKCGTTWMQQIVHQLRSGGDMSFEDIDDVVPWIDLAYDVGQDLNDEQKFEPRCFKTHCWYETRPKEAKYIVVYREPCAAFYSAYNFFKHKRFNPEEISLDEYVTFMHLVRVVSAKSKWEFSKYFEHLLSWWPHRNDPNVLFLLYEEMLENLETTVRAVASFMGITNEASVKNAINMSTFGFMKQNQSQFATIRFTRYKQKIPGVILPPLERVFTGSATKGREMMEDCTKQAVQNEWNRIIANQTGIQDYDMLRATLTKEKRPSL